MAADTGIARLSIEDSSGDKANPLFDFELAVERVAAARRGIDESGTRIVLTGTSEGFVCGRHDIEETIRRLCTYAEASADCLYAPRIDNLEHVVAIVSAVSPKPVNLLINARSPPSPRQLSWEYDGSASGARSRGPPGQGFLAAAGEIADAGTFSRFEHLPTSTPCSAGERDRVPRTPAAPSAQPARSRRRASKGRSSAATASAEPPTRPSQTALRRV